LAVEKVIVKGAPVMRLLLIEEEKELAEALTAALSKQGVVTDHTMRLADACELTRQNTYDVILVDRRLPDSDGLTFIPTFRRAGVYLGKPFLVDELMARLRAVLRRPANLVEPQIMVGGIVIDPRHLNVTVNATPFDLPRRELLVLVALAKRKDKTVLRSILEAAVYNYEEEIQSNALDAHISRLRKRLSDASAGVSPTSRRWRSREATKSHLKATSTGSNGLEARQPWRGRSASGAQCDRSRGQCGDDLRLRFD
jgi:DNA-binding response OmpR family regulator